MSGAAARPHADRASFAQTFLLALGAVLVSGLLGSSEPSQWLGPRAFDWMSIVEPVTPEADDVVVVAIDESSFAQYGQWPWSRGRHAELVRSLRAAGARTIVLDLIFAEPSADAGADRALALAMGPDVVLAADWVVTEESSVALKQFVAPLQILTAHGAREGLAGVMPDTDGVLRRIPQRPSGAPEVDMLAVRALKTAYGDAAVPAVPNDALIQYFGPARSYPTVSYYQALEAETMLPPGIFKDRVVFVGFGQKAAADVTHPQADSFATAYTILTGTLTFGAEIHATVFDNLRHGLWIRPAPEAISWLGALLVALLTSQVLRHFHPIRSVIWTVVGLAAILLSSYALLRWGRYWVSPVLPAGTLILVAVSRTALSFLQERARRRWVTNAFGHYVSPDMVAQLLENPDRLKLGGETRELTFLFCDLRGFTPISESMQSNPEALTHLVNRIMTALTDCVQAERGTVDKFIGDCLMAFWNAPLDEPDHALRAVRAGIAMARQIERLSVELEGEGLPRIAVGVGINTGRCVVGNMGSARNFNYTALGDAVNLAARLESASKELGVTIVIGPETARQVGDRLPLRSLGSIKVKGKQDAIEVSTVAA
jgi:adenylate cyclase